MSRLKTFLTNVISNSSSNRARRSASRRSIPTRARSSARRRLLIESLETRQVCATFTVINTDDSGAGSLRQAIIDANNSAGTDIVEFNIPGAGVHTIEPLTSLPTSTDITIDGTTQPGYASGGPKLIELSGVNYEFNTFPDFFFDNGLVVNNNSTVKGLAVNRFYTGILVQGSNNHIAGNYIGTDPTGSVGLANHQGVYTQFGTNNVVGTNSDGVNDTDERNVISANEFVGVYMGGDHTLVAGNYIGTDATGSYALDVRQFTGIRGGGFDGKIVGNLVSGNSEGINPAGDNLKVQGNYIGYDKSGQYGIPNGHGIFLQFLNSPVLVGGSTPQTRNYIAGNNLGIRSFVDSVIRGNSIGRTHTGILLGNSQGIESYLGNNIIGGRLPGEGNLFEGNGSGIVMNYKTTGIDLVEGNVLMHNGIGVAFHYGSSNQIIGGTAPGSGNTIANNWGTGIFIGSQPGRISKQNRIVGNSIYGNGGLGIDLSVNNFGPDGVTPNDPFDEDASNIGYESNELQNFPVLTTASSASTTRVQGSLHSTPNSTFTIDFYASSAADPSGYGEGERYLGATTVSTDANGNATFNAVIPAASTAGEYITSTATDALGNTSEFSLAIVSVQGVQTVAVDIQPDSVNVASNGTLTVVVFGAADFNAARIDVNTVRFAGAAAWQAILVDANNDGRLDMQFKFRRQDTTLDQIYIQLLIADHDADGVLDSTTQIASIAITGQTLDGGSFTGSDTVALFMRGQRLRDLLAGLFG